MRVLHIISSGGMYGAEAVILNLSLSLNRGPHSSILGVFSNRSNPNHQLYERAAGDGLESHLIPCDGQIDRTAVIGIRELAARTRADVVHAHGYKADTYVYFALRGTGIPLISTCHTWYDNDRMAYLYGVADRLVLRKYARVVAVSDDVRQRLLKAGVQRAKIHLVRNGIDLRPFSNAVPSLRGDASPSSDPVIGLVGRLAEEKGIDIFLGAAVRVLDEFPTARFVVVGEGPDRAKLELLIDELKIRRGVSLLGRRDDMPSVYASLDVMVSASRREGLPIAILEGMASGLPLVATAVGEVPSVVLDGCTGLLISPESPDLLAERVKELLRDSVARKRLGLAARQLVEEKYSAERMASDYLAVYAEAVDTVKRGNSSDEKAMAAPQGNAK